MDKRKAEQIELKLKGKYFSFYRIISLINHGKSAAVFKAENITNKHIVALKIFDNDLVERFGHEIQNKRIEQEISLKGHSIQNLISIIHGEKLQIENEIYYYIVMEYIEGMNLKEFIQKSIYDNELVTQVAKILFSVTENLLKQGVVHRDIKPENIMISNDNYIVLMDLGVLNYVNIESFSDIDEKQFVGTLRYGPPEFLSRTEDGTIECWRAINLYQIGAVMHDMIMKKELFHQYTPYTNLVKAIFDEAPNVSNEDYPFLTIQLVRDLLIKDWKKRSELCKIERMEQFYSKKENEYLDLDSATNSLFSTFSDNKAKYTQIQDLRKSNEERNIQRKKSAELLAKEVQKSFVALKDRGVINNFEMIGNFTFPVKYKGGHLAPGTSHPVNYSKHNLDNYTDNSLFFKLQGDYAMGYKSPLYLLLRIQNDENSLAIISALCVFLGVLFHPEKYQNHSSNIILDIAKDTMASSQRKDNVYNIDTCELFNGVVGFDKQFNELLSFKLLSLIKTALIDAKSEVLADLERMERREKGEKNIHPMAKSSKTKVYITLT